MKWIENFNLTQGLSLVSIPIVGYVSAFFYLSGKYSFYDLPIFFVEINTELAIFASLVVVIVILSISLSIYLYYN
ncbi:hypothetical protein COY14_01585 [Candidatus Roizmanbacteria bacterium CG_4_10_14_0_2_um_filter_36_9]|uniref:Uncharacterized protein n=1 Tax=Candidatus Roizmanbacteria bacterium CG_4_10_14_0_2_um_filter_36_9 TaxID=1974823 RepID=A0A2M7U4V9_9BACT|nr:MAG: hypothetical protein COY14_01585 [Candidatus Roizmanbacteria bacterium CG_4_10_14_0_2_um_filter_36_9]